MTSGAARAPFFALVIYFINFGITCGVRYRKEMEMRLGSKKKTLMCFVCVKSFKKDFLMGLEILEKFNVIRII
jgi:hypothetical protein